MALKLRVISEQYKALGKRGTRVFGPAGGRIGRAQDNDWVLPDSDRYVSSHHCKVQLRDGHWVLEDTSTNGVFVNGAETPLSIDGPCILKDGDRVRLGDYELLVSIEEPQPSAQHTASRKAAARPAQPSASSVEDDLGEELDLTDLLSDTFISSTDTPAKRAIATFEMTRSAAVSEAEPVKAPAPTARPAATPPPAVASPSKPPRSGISSLLDPPARSTEPSSAPTPKPDDWQMQTRPYDRKTLTALSSPATLARSETSETQRRRSLSEAGSTEPATGVEAFCRGAGIDPAHLSTDAQNAVLTIAGQVLRETVLGLMEALKGRAATKGQLHLNQTTIQPGENNPLKFSSSVDEAVLKLLDPHGSRYLGPVEAIRDSFADLRQHQTALSGATQEALDELLKRIAPAELQERFDRGLKRGALLGAANKMKYWDLYAEFYQALNQRNEQGMPTLFAEELARSYAERTAHRRR